MQQEEQQNLIERILHYHNEGVTDMLDEVSKVSVSVYFDEQQYSREEEKLFKTLPICVGHNSQLQEVGDYIARDICSVPIILLRDSNNHLRAFLNVCKHRGGRFIRDGQGSDLRALVCHYHAWTYSIEGQLRGIPKQHGFDGMPEYCRSLTELPLCDWQGFLLLRLTPLRSDETIDSYRTAVNEFIGEQLNIDFSGFNLAEHIVFEPKEFQRPINWKLAIDTFLENYHVRKTHRNTIDAMFLDTVGCYEHFGYQQRNLYPKKSITSLVDVARDKWQLRDHGNLLYLLFPNTLILIEPDHVNVSMVYPDGVGDSTLINFTLLPSKPDKKKTTYFRRNNTLLYEALEEDFAAASDVQKGLKSGANEFLLHGKFEQGLRYFHASVDTLTCP